ncbi:MAG: hypothetical protein AABY87_13650 [bacterium]
MPQHYDKTCSPFDDSELGTERSRNKDLKIAAVQNKKLTKNQQTFNRLSKRIEQLQNAIHRDSAKLEAVLKAYNADIPALQRSIAANRLSLAKSLGETTKRIKYGKRQAADVRNVILILCDEAFSQIEPDVETEQFYNAWSRSNYQQEVQSQKDAMKRMFSEEVKGAFGLDIDFGEMGGTPEEMARFASRIQSEIMNNGKQQERRCSGRKKSKKQIEQEELRKRKEIQQTKSMRSLYLSLAKALHPDTEMDGAEKMRKEELMKKVTVAYAGKDIAALLKLEMEWVASESHDLGTLPDEKLKLYIASLKEQVAALEVEHASVFYNPRFMPINDFWHLPEQQAVHEIWDLKQACTRLHGYLINMTDVCSDTSRKKDIVDFVKEYIAMADFDLSDPLGGYLVDF